MHHQLIGKNREKNIDVNKGAKLVDAGGALAPTGFVVLKPRTYYKFLASRSRSLGKSRKVSSAPTLFRLDWRPCMSRIHISFEIELLLVRS